MSRLSKAFGPEAPPPLSVRSSVKVELFGREARALFGTGVPFYASRVQLEWGAAEPNKPSDFAILSFSTAGGGVVQRAVSVPALRSALEAAKNA